RRARRPGIGRRQVEARPDDGAHAYRGAPQGPARLEVGDGNAKPPDQVTPEYVARQREFTQVAQHDGSEEDSDVSPPNHHFCPSARSRRKNVCNCCLASSAKTPELTEKVWFRALSTPIPYRLWTAPAFGSNAP